MAPESPKKSDISKYLDPKTLTKIGNLDIKARLIVEGYISGLHKSPYHGFSVEFAEHREYTPGDDLKHLDWKVLGKTDRLYIKQYEEETNLRSYILLDTSESMKYASPGNISKLEYASYIAASLAYLLIRQQDSVGMVLFDNAIKKFIPASSSPAHLRLLLHELTQIVPEQRTDVGTIFHDLAERIKRKGLVIILSDLFDDPEKILFGMQHFRHKRHEVILCQILDDFEIRFPFENMTLFEGYEGWQELLCDPRALRKGYLEEYESFTEKLKRGCRNNKIDYVPVNTKNPLDVVLSAYLSNRLGSKFK
ncbi:MAG: DUF58 domain-containing protein [Planctomycetes bacterium]|nr:DUF58 domain-containing protein [Planctomycetota bacterium]